MDMVSSYSWSWYWRNNRSGVPNLDMIHVGLKEFITRWDTYVMKRKTGGLMERVRQLLNPSSYDYDQFFGSLSDSVNQLRQSWFFLEMIFQSIAWSGSAEFLQRSKSLIQKVEHEGTEISRRLKFSGRYKSSCLKRPDELFSLLGECHGRTDELFKDFSEFSIRALSDAPESGFWSGFVPVLGNGLLLLKDASGAVLNENELLSISRYLTYLEKGLSSDPAMGAFLTHVASVVLRISVQSCHFWFNRTDPETAKVMFTQLLDLHKEIDPTNPEFLQLNLKLHESLYKINPEKMAADESASIGHFCSYLLVWVGNEDLRKELMSLVTIFINNTLEDGGEDVQSFFAEIKAVLGETAISHRRGQKQATSTHPPCSDLLEKLCLLKAELFLKEQLNTHTPFDDNQFFKVRMILTSVRAFTKDQSQQGSTEYVKQNLVLAEELAKEIDSFQKLYHSKRITYPLVKHSLSQLLFKIVFFKAESHLTDLLKSRDASIANENDQIQSLPNDLNFFKRIVMINRLVRDSSGEEIIIIQVEAVSRGITLLSYSFLPESDKFQKMIHSLPQLLDKAKMIKAKLGEINEQLPKSIFPKTYEVGFIDFLGRNISELLKHDPESIAPVRHHIEEALLHLQSLKSTLQK